MADRGYYNGAEVMECDEAGITPLMPKPMTSNRSDGRFAKQDFVYNEANDGYRCPAGADLKRLTSFEWLTLHNYWSSKCRGCPIKAQCTTSNYRRIARWVHEAYSRT